MTDKPDLSQTVHDLKLARDGDDEAANRLWERYYEKIVPAVRIRLGAKLRSKVETMDIVQNVFLEAISSADKKEFKSEGHFRSWISHMVENRIRKTARDFSRQKRDINKERQLLDTHGQVRSDRPDLSRRPISILEEFDDLERMEKAMELMPRSTRELLVMRFFDELSFAEIGERTERTEDAARKAVNRAVALLGQKMD